MKLIGNSAMLRIIAICSAYVIVRSSRRKLGYIRHFFESVLRVQ